MLHQTVHDLELCALFIKCYFCWRFSFAHVWPFVATAHSIPPDPGEGLERRRTESLCWTYCPGPTGLHWGQGKPLAAYLFLLNTHVPFVVLKIISVTNVAHQAKILLNSLRQNRSVFCSCSLSTWARLLCLRRQVPQGLNQDSVL